MTRRLLTEATYGAAFIAFWCVAFWMAGAGEPVI